MLENMMKIFINDFSIYSSSFEDCLLMLNMVLQRCKKINLVLSWEKGHFIFREEIVLRHIVFEHSIKVEKVK